MNVLTAALFGLILAIVTTVKDGANSDLLPVSISSNGEVLDFQDLAAFKISVDHDGKPAYHASLSASDAKSFSDFTERHVQEILSVFVCQTLVMEPRLQTRISGGTFLIVGDDATELLTGYLENGCP